MALNVIVCDDSKFARNQLIRVIPKSVIKNLYQASNGAEAMELMRQGKGELLFLDLTMPVMDGYQVLEAIKQESIDIMKIVVSGDIQQQAASIIAQYNVLAFIKKPMNPEELKGILTQYGICEDFDIANQPIEKTNENLTEDEKLAIQFDVLKEKFNIATGQAASKLADVLNLFITMPVPNVRIRKGAEFSEKIRSWLEIDDNLVISQGFIGNQILGESIFYFSVEDINSYTHLVGEPNAAKKEKISQIIELAGLISGTLMRGFASQMNYILNLTHPAIIPNLKTNLADEHLIDSYILSVELVYEIRDLNMQIQIDVLFTQQATEKLKEIMAFV